MPIPIITPDDYANYGKIVLKHSEKNRKLRSDNRGTVMMRAIPQWGQSLRGTRHRKEMERRQSS